MNKELNRLLDSYTDDENFDYCCYISIEKKLNALDIIKDKVKIEFKDSYLGFKDNYYIVVNNDLLCAIKVNKEEYDLLKEVLNDEH